MKKGAILCTIFVYRGETFTEWYLLYICLDDTSDIHTSQLFIGDYF